MASCTLNRQQRNECCRDGGENCGIQWQYHSRCRRGVALIKAAARLPLRQQSHPPYRSPANSAKQSASDLTYARVCVLTTHLRQTCCHQLLHQRGRHKEAAAAVTQALLK